MWLVVLAVGLAGALAGCSSKPGNPSAASATVPANPVVVIQAGRATVSGTAASVLTTTEGLTLYYRTSDTLSSVCSGRCAATWPPLLLNSGRPTATPTVQGELAVRSDINGRQVIVGGHPLYTYSGDTQAGEASGNGVGGIWFAATPDLGADEG